MVVSYGSYIVTDTDACLLLIHGTKTNETKTFFCDCLSDCDVAASIFFQLALNNLHLTTTFFFL
jgi:hypothetical protein